MLKRWHRWALIAMVVGVFFSGQSTFAARAWATVNRGDNGANVYAVQSMLKQRGYSITIDGDFGPGTESVVKSFQSGNGLAADGVVGPLTWEKLVVTVRQGDNNVVVSALQRELNKHGKSLTVDGDFGPATKSAVTSFQSSKGLAADGVVGPDTWAALTQAASGGGSGGYVLPLARSALPRTEYDDPHHDYPAIDLPVGTGTPVYAVRGGTATRINDSSCGLGYNISSSDGAVYTYCHFSRHVAASGSVSTGDLIGYSGNTGNSTGPHLHFGIKTGTTRRCPQKLLLAIYDGSSVPAPSSLPTTGCFY